ncbi:MAG TPA: Os1348 family NHLP clan protein [Candidatus Methylomirabilis sp.]|nr:Os1348 family NHLP clan protein [Candidatus Methylomirabilis sp.]HSC70320.1 Os1348 family NHLP clan protein [Candidatus Methylomirabilis sp.]
MSQAAVEKALGKLITDECFRGRFLADPAAASFSAGLDLSPAELDALSRLPGKAIARFGACLDDRIRRIPLDEEGRPPQEGTAQGRRRRLAGGAGSPCHPVQNAEPDQNQKGHHSR